MASVLTNLTNCGRDLESLCTGCRKECNQKCVIDNHEVEILHTQGLELPAFSEHSCCPSGRVGSLSSVGSDFCTPRPVPLIQHDLRPRTASGMGSVHFGLESERELPLLASPRVLRRGMSLPVES
mmetsp:Transcript_63595/g.113174  ORF Transcript_63595/g.113174 Transcript_63595/m.113174 type:complete len:125 (+) Transcript_63595:79-453(+)